MHSKTIMANKELNRLKVVLAEKRKRQMAWNTTGKGQNNHIKMVY